MAEMKRMTADEVVGYLLEGEGLDFLRESLTWVCQQLMEAEVSELARATVVRFRTRSPIRTNARLSLGSSAYRCLSSIKL